MWKEMSYNRTTPSKTSRIRFEQHSITEKNDFYNTQVFSFSDEFNPAFEFDSELRIVEKIIKD